MGKLSRTKGKAFERAVAKVLRPLFGSRIRRGFQTRSGRDESDIEGTPWWIECKHEKCVNVRKAMAQAQLATDGRPVVVVAKDNNAPPFICMSLDAWIALIEAVVPQSAVLALKELAHEEIRRPPVNLKRPKIAEPKKTGREPLGQRRCHVCGDVWVEPGSYQWDAHYLDGAGLVDTCSARCRVSGGFRERKVTA